MGPKNLNFGNLTLKILTLARNFFQRRRVERIGTQEASNLASHDIFSGKTSVDRSRILVNVLFIRFSIC